MRNQLLLIVMISIFFPALAQERLKHEQKMYKSPDGKLYVNKKLPFYLWISMSPGQDAEKVRLESQNSKAFVNPFYFDTEAYNTIRTPSKVDTVTKKAIVPQEDIIWEVYADSYAPKTSVSFSGSILVKKGKSLCAGASLKVSFNAEDQLSGVERTIYSIDGAPFLDFKDSILLDQEKEYTVAFYSVDNVGNAEPTNTRKITIDKSSPTSALEFVGDASDGVVSSRSKLKIVANDSASGVKRILVSIDNGQQFVYSGAVPLSGFSEGEHSATFFSVDNLGNAEVPKTKTFFVDRTGPILIDELLGDSYFVNGREYTSGRSQLKLTAIDNKAGVKDIFFTTDGENYMIYTVPFYLPNTDGNIIVKFYAVDKVNNKSDGTGTGSKFRIASMDLTGPRVNHRYVGQTFRNRDTTFINPQTKIVLWGTDGQSGMRKMTYSANNEKELDYTQPMSFEKEGVYSFSYRGYDNVNNSSFSNIWFIVDKTGPDIFVRYSIESIGKSGELDVYPSHTVVFVSATDNDAGFDRLLVSTNGKPYVPYTGYINRLSKNTKYNLKVKAFDKLGNFKESSFDFKTGD